MWPSSPRGRAGPSRLGTSCGVSFSKPGRRPTPGPADGVTDQRQAPPVHISWEPAEEDPVLHPEILIPGPK